MKISYEISVEGDPLDGYDVSIDGNLIQHFNSKEYDNYDLARAITGELESALENQIAISKKSIDTLTIGLAATSNFDEVMNEYGIEYGDKIYNPFLKLVDDDSVELGIRLDRKKGKVYITMVNGVMLERDAELI